MVFNCGLEVKFCGFHGSCVFVVVEFMLNKTPRVQKRRGQSEAAVIKYIAILATKSFDIKLRPRISQLAI